MEDAKETASSKHNRSDVHRNSQRLEQHPQGLHKFKPERISAMNAEVDMGSHP